MQIHDTAYQLIGKNYLKWPQLIKTILKGKGKLNHIIGTGPKEVSPSFVSWDEQDSMIMAWLWNSMSPKLSDKSMFLPTTREIWESIWQIYSKVKDAAQIYELRIKTMSTK